MLHSQAWLERHIGEGPTFPIGIGGFRKEHLQDAAYTFTLSSIVRVPEPGRVLDLRDQTSPKYACVRMDEREGYVLRPGKFVLCAVSEELSLAPDVACLLSTHPKAAQSGIDFLQTSTLIPAGSRCFITLETRNNGPFLVRLYPGMKAAKGVFLRVK